jgi:GT2 family glycosyltransferase
LIASFVSTDQPEITSNISVVILNWNGGEMVCETITSVLSTDRPNTTVIVVDNASTDGSDKEIQRRFPQITLIRNPTNLGFAAGNNVGIRHALEQGADCVLLLNNDALLDGSTIQVMVAALLTAPDRGIVVPKIYVHPSGEKRTLWAAGALWRAFPPRVTMRGYGDIDDGQYDRPGNLEYATACALLVRRETFQAAGLLDEAYFMYQEDYAFCDRVRASGLTLWYEPAAVVHHRVSASTGEGSAEKWRYWSEGIARFYVQRYGSRSRALVPLTTFLLWAIMRQLVKGRLRWLKPFWQGVRAGWDELY